MDVSGLDAGESVRVHDVSLPNVRVLADGDLPIASVVAPTAGPSGDADTATGEPEVLTAKAAQNT